MIGRYFQEMVGEELVDKTCKLFLYTDTTVCRRYSYDGRAGSISFRITFEVKVQRAEEVRAYMCTLVNSNKFTSKQFVNFLTLQ